MDSVILLFLVQDGLVNGAIYALLGIALVLVFAVTRIIFIPQGEFVAYGGLTFALLSTGTMPGTAWLLAVFGAAAFVVELWRNRHVTTGRKILGQFAGAIVLPAAVVALTWLLARPDQSVWVNLALTLAIVAPMGPYVYRVAFQPLADASVLTLFIAAVGVHLSMVGLGLVFFGAEGLRAPALTSASFDLGPLPVTGQTIAVFSVALLLIAALYLFFDRVLYGKALRATAINRLGARLVGIPTTAAGQIAFALSSALGAVSGVLIVPVTTVYYDTGFLIGLKGFVAAIVGALASYPVTAIAALGVGLVEAFASFYASSFKEVIVFLLIVPVLMWRSLQTVHIEEDE
ncbi:MAG: branched-chain amino acid ABC transporter permease [Rhodoplanes sp.]